mmetsp:Transcript_15810/g.21737  ORF Transcript_15810/g.21737 Transcript_15810/m.21737 type:complete len:204 (+) Transcript_15810:817-1428(+)
MAGIPPQRITAVIDTNTATTTTAVITAGGGGGDKDALDLFGGDLVAGLVVNQLHQLRDDLLVSALALPEVLAGRTLPQHIRRLRVHRGRPQGMLVGVSSDPAASLHAIGALPVVLRALHCEHIQVRRTIPIADTARVIIARRNRRRRLGGIGQDRTERFLIGHFSGLHQRNTQSVAVEVLGQVGRRLRQRLHGRPAQEVVGPQ